MDELNGKVTSEAYKEQIAGGCLDVCYYMLLQISFTLTICARTDFARCRAGIAILLRRVHVHSPLAYEWKGLDAILIHSVLEDPTWQRLV